MNGLLGDLPEFQDEMRGMQVFNQPIPQQQQPKGDVSFLEKMAIFLAPTAYQNISNVKSMRQQEAGTQGMDLPGLVDYWSTRDPQKAQQYATILQQQKAQQAEQARQQSVQEVLGGVAPTQASGNQGYAEQAENLARAGIQLMQRGDLVGGEALLKQAEQLQKLRTKRDSVNLGNRVEMIDPFSDGQMSIGVSPDSALAAATTRRGQDFDKQRFDAEQEQGQGVGRTKPLNPTEIKLFDESESMANSSRNAVDALTKALEINDKAYFGVLGKPKAVIEGQFGGNEAADATILFENLVSEQALASLKAIFGAAPTESDVRLLMQLQASVNKPPSQRKQILERAVQAAKRKEQEARKRMEALATGQYGTPSYLQDQGSGFKVIGRE